VGVVDGVRLSGFSFDPLTIALVTAAILCAISGHLVAGIVLAAFCGTAEFKITMRRR
jgi:hypothetical protein